MNLSTTFTGVRFDNPFLLSSAPPTESESNITRAFEAGWGGVVTKTIGLHPVVNVYGAKAKFMRTNPEDANVSMKKRTGAALHSSWNWELISDKTLEWWAPRIRRIKEAFPNKVLIASIMAGSGNDKELRHWQELAETAQGEGADGFEINVDGLVSSGGLGGPAILPLSLAKMAQLTKAFPDKNFSGIGGISDFNQALSYFLLGCGTAQVCTAAMLDQAIGPNVIRKLLAGLDRFLEEHAKDGWKRVEDFRGIRR